MNNSNIITHAQIKITEITEKINQTRTNIEQNASLIQENSFEDTNSFIQDVYDLYTQKLRSIYSKIDEVEKLSDQLSTLNQFENNCKLQFRDMQKNVSDLIEDNSQSNNQLKENNKFNENQEKN